MTDREALLHAIAERPSDPLRRLVFADYLQENCHESRAAFVRLRCEAERVGRDSPLYDDLLREGDDLLREHEREWVGEWADRLVDWEYDDGGFVRSVRMTASQFEKHGAELFTWEPIERFHFQYEPDDATTPDGLVQHPSFAHVRAVEINSDRSRWATGWDVSAWLRGLASATHATKLTEFVSGSGGANRLSVEAFCRAPHLAKLNRFVLNGASAGQDPDERAWLIQALSGSPFAKRLRQLELARSGLGYKGLEQLAHATAFPNLWKLDVRGSRNEGLWKRLLDSPSFKLLTDIAIPSCALRFFPHCPIAGRLRGLSVTFSGEEWDHYPTKTRTSWLKLLQKARRPGRLEFDQHNPGEAVFDQMRESGWLSEVRELKMRSDSQENVFRGNDLAAIARWYLFAETLPVLSDLRLHECTTGASVAAITGGAGIERLRTLAITDDYLGGVYQSTFRPGKPPTALQELCGMGIGGDEAADHFATALALADLRVLSFKVIEGDLSADGLRRFLASPGLRGLRELQVGA